MKLEQRLHELQKLLTDEEEQEIEYSEHIKGQRLELRITVWDRNKGQRIDTLKAISFDLMNNSVEGPDRYVDFTFRVMCEEIKAAIAKWYS